MIGVYGSKGFIGRHIVQRLAEKGMAARAVNRRQDVQRGSFGSIEHVEADLGDSMAMAASLQDVDTVVQLISTSSPGLRNDHAIEDIEENVIPHIAFLQNCVRVGVKRYIFLSSGGTIYGPGSSRAALETDATNPICSHGLTKMMVEKYIQMHGVVDNLDFVILRLANPFGPGQEFKKGQGLIPALIDRYQRKQPVTLFGTGDAQRDYVFIEDVIDAIVAAIDLPGNPRHILNIGSGNTHSVIQVVEAIERITGYQFTKHRVEARKTDVDVSHLDIRQAQAVLGWQPNVSFEDGIVQTLEHVLAGLN